MYIHTFTASRSSFPISWSCLMANRICNITVPSICRSSELEVATVISLHTRVAQEDQEELQSSTITSIPATLSLSLPSLSLPFPPSLYLLPSLSLPLHLPQHPSPVTPITWAIIPCGHPIKLIEQPHNSSQDKSLVSLKTAYTRRGTDTPNLTHMNCIQYLSYRLYIQYAPALSQPSPSHCHSQSNSMPV